MKCEDVKRFFGNERLSKDLTGPGLQILRSHFDEHEKNC